LKVVVVGAGAREHALIRKLGSESAVDEVLAVGTNAGIAQDAEVLAKSFGDVQATSGLIESVRPDLVVIGPEAPLVAGLSDMLVTAGINVFGPCAAAARLESSKVFAKEVMAKAGVSTAQAHSCDSLAQVETALASRQPPFVVKDDSLAAGKGVVVTSDLDTALDHARVVLTGGSTVLVEDFLVGEEASLFFVCDGTNAVPLMPSRDHKRLKTGDLGPNTGGMGSYSPLQQFPMARAHELVEQIALPVLAKMKYRGIPFTGLLYAGLMVNGDDVKIVEFNARFGDPETQSVLLLMKSSLSEFLLAAAEGDVRAAQEPQWLPSAALTVVMAAPGYPEQPEVGAEITGLDRANALEGVEVYHAGTRPLAGGGPLETDKAEVNGGRVLSVSAVGVDLAQARARAYAGVESIEFEGAQYRQDIGEQPNSNIE